MTKAGVREERIGNCRLILGDCRSVLPTLDLVGTALITDPPYGTHDLGGGYGRRQLHSANGREGRTIANDRDLSCFSDLLSAFGGSRRYALVFYAPRRTSELIDAIGEWELVGGLVWDKKQMGLGYTVRYSHESIAVLQLGKVERPLFAIDSVITCHERERLHPHQKPVELMKRLVSWQSGAVFDPFMGSGTTLVACANLGRAGIGIEIDPAYFDIACRRVEATYAQPRLFEEPAPRATQDALL